MCNALQREIGQYDDRVCLEVGAKLLSCHMEGECCLFEMGIPSLCFRYIFAYEEYRFLLSVFVFFEQNKVALIEASDTTR